MGWPSDDGPCRRRHALRGSRSKRSSLVVDGSRSVENNRAKVVVSASGENKERRSCMPSDINPMAYLNLAREYSDAADELLKVSEQRPKIYGHRELSDPISFLYFHAIELAFKAFLRSHNQKIPTGGRASHDIA